MTNEEAIATYNQILFERGYLVFADWMQYKIGQIVPFLNAEGQHSDLPGPFIVTEFTDVADLKEQIKRAGMPNIVGPAPYFYRCKAE